MCVCVFAEKNYWKVLNEILCKQAPAKYEFEYMVYDPPSGNDFGHKESRDGEMTRGVYYVLLPDGRRQMVEYEADQDGYRPKITYMQEGNGIGGGAGGYGPSGGVDYGRNDYGRAADFGGRADYGNRGDFQSKYNFL